VSTVSSKQNKSFVGTLKASDEKSRVLIRLKMSRIRSKKNYS
jgi:hypothetical protein